MAEKTGGDPIKDFYNSVLASQKMFSSENEFRKVVTDPKTAKDFYESALAPKGYFNDYAEFESSLGLKKKDLRSEAASIASGSALETAESSALPSVSQSSSQSNQLAKNQSILDDAIGGLTPAGNIPKEGEQTISQVSNVAPSQLVMPKKLQPTSDGQDLVDSFARGSSNLGKMLAETPSFVYDLAAMPQNIIAKYTGLPIAASSQQFAETVGLPENEVASYYDNAIKQSQEKINAKYDKGISEYFSNGEYDKGFKLMANQIMESAPISISLAMGNAGGLTPAQSILGGGAVFGAGKKAELDESNPNMSETDKMNNALSTGLFEGIFEQFGITKLGGAVKDILAKEGKDIAKDLAEKGFKETYGPIFKKYLGVSFEESLSEAATQFAQNSIDKYSGAKPDLDLTDGLVDAAIIGFGAGSTFSAAPTAMEVVKTKKGLNEAVKINAEREKLQNDLNSPNIAEAARQTISNRIGELNQEDADLAVDEKQKYSVLPAEAKTEVDDLVRKSSEIQASLDQTDISEDAKKLLESELEKNESRVDEIYKESEKLTVGDKITDTDQGIDGAQSPTEGVPTETAPTVATSEVSQETIQPLGADTGSIQNEVLADETATAPSETAPNSVSDAQSEDVSASIPVTVESETVFDSATSKEQFIPQIEQRAKELSIELPQGKSEAVYESVREKLSDNPDIDIPQLVDEAISEYMAEETAVPTKQQAIESIRAKVEIPDADFSEDLQAIAEAYKADGVDNPVDFASAVREEIPNLPQAVTNKMLTDAFVAGVGAIKESKTRRSFDAATKGISTETRESVSTKYKERTVGQSSNKADALWEQIEKDYDNIDDALDEGEALINTYAYTRAGLDNVDLPVFATKIATKLHEARNIEGKTPEQIADYDRRAVSIFNKVRETLTLAGQTSSIGGQYLKDALMAYPEGVAAMVQMDIMQANEARYGKLPEKTVEEITGFLDDLNKSDEGKEAIAQFVERFTGAKRKTQVRKKYTSGKKLINDLFDDFIEQNLPADPRKSGGRLNSGLPVAVVLRPALRAIQKGITLGLTVAEAVELGMVEVRRYYKKGYESGELPSPDFDEKSTKAFLETTTERVMKEAERIESLSDEQREAYEKSKSEAKRIRLEEKIKEKLQSEADARVSKAKEALERFEQGRAKREKLQEESDRLAREQEGAESDEKERIARKRADVLQAIRDARKEENTLRTEQRIAEREAKAIRDKINKLSGDKLAKFTYQLVNQMGMGKVTPEQVQEAYYKMVGGYTLSEKQFEKIKSLAFTLTEIERNKENVWDGNASPSQSAEFKRRTMKAQGVREQIMSEMKRAGFLDLVQYNLTGNLMTIKSLLGGGFVSNVVNNLWSYPRDFVASPIDWALTYALGQERGKKQFYPSLSEYKAKGLGYLVGGEAGLRELKNGPTDDNTDWSSNYNAKPVEAFKRIAEDWNDNTPKMEKAYRVTMDLFEGSSVWSTFIFRSLNLSDKVFRTASTMQIEQQLVEELGISMEEFQTSEEYKEWRDVANELGAKDTFQGKDIISRIFQNVNIPTESSNPLLRTAAKAFNAFLVKPILPFKKTPLNVAEEVVKIAFWPVSLVSFAANFAAAKSESNPAKKTMYRKLAARDASILTISITMGVIFSSLVESGVLGFSGDDDDKKDEKARQNRLFFEGMPNRIIVNLPWGKKTYSVNALGPQGMALSLMYQNYVNQSEEERDFFEQLADAGWSTMQVLRESTFLAALNDAMKSTDDKERFATWLVRTYGVNYTRTVLPAINNQITEMTDAEQVKRITKDESLMNQLYNDAIRKNLGFISNITRKVSGNKIESIAYDELPVMYNIMGEQVKTNPDGKPDLLHYLFDFTGSEDFRLEDAPMKKIFLKYLETKNPDWLFPIATKQFSFSHGGRQIFKGELTPQMKNEYQKYLGEEMKSVLKNLTAEELVSLDYFERAKEIATEAAKGKFYLANKQELTKKKEGDALKKPFVPKIYN